MGPRPCDQYRMVVLCCCYALTVDSVQPSIQLRPFHVVTIMQYLLCTYYSSWAHARAQPSCHAAGAITDSFLDDSSLTLHT